LTSQTHVVPVYEQFGGKTKMDPGFGVVMSVRALSLAAVQIVLYILGKVTSRIGYFVFFMRFFRG
jgi:hypothetical protein